MATLIQRRLAGLPEGTHLELTYVDGQKISEARGVISETDGEESFAFITEEGEELVLTFTEVRSFKKKDPVSVPSSMPSVTAPPDQPAGGTVLIPGSATMDVSRVGTSDRVDTVPESTDASIEAVTKIPQMIVPFFRVEIKGPNYSVQSLKQHFGALQRSSRTHFASAYDSFVYGQKNHDSDKSRIAAGKIAEEAANELSSDQDSLAFAGLALSMVERHEEAGNMFARADHCGQAAVEFYLAGNKDRAGACAMQAIIDNSSESGTNEFFTILEDSILETKDIGALENNWENIPNVYHGELDVLIRSLASSAGCALHRPQGFSSDFHQLSPYYKGNAISAYNAELKVYKATIKASNGADVKSMAQSQASESVNIQDLLAKWTGGDSSSKDTDGGVSPAAMHDTAIGYVASASWMREAGTIISTAGSEYNFSYNDVTDAELKAQLKVVNNEMLLRNPVSVQFKTEGRKAVNIGRMQDVVLTVKDILRHRQNSNDLPLAVAFLNNTAPGSVDTQCLLLLLQTALEYSNKHEEQDILNQVRQIYLNNRDKIGIEEKGYSSVIQFYRVLGENEAACNMLERALQGVNLSHKLRLDYHRLYIRLLREIYEDSEDESPLRKCLEQTSQFAEDYLSSEESVRKNDHYTSYYLRGRHLDDAECWNLLRDYKNMEDSILKISEIDMPVQDRDRLNVLKRKLRMLKGEDNVSPEVPKAEEINTVPSEEKDEKINTSSTESAKAPDFNIKSNSPKNDITDITPFGLDNDDVDEGTYVYNETGSLETAGLSKKDIIDYAISAKGEGRLAVMLSYLKAGSQIDESILPTYQMVSLAVDNPMETQDYSAASLLTCLNDADSNYSTFAQYCLAAATLRSAFISPDSLPHVLMTVHNSISIFTEFPEMEKLFSIMNNFRRDFTIPLDNLAAYRGADEKSINEKISRLSAQATVYFDQFISANRRDGNGVKRLMETKKVIFADDGLIASYLRNIKNKDFDALGKEQNDFSQKWLKGNAVLISPDSLSNTKIDAYIKEVWDSVDSKRRSFKLQGARLTNLRTNLRTILRLVCEFYGLMYFRGEKGNELTRNSYKHILPDLMSSAESLADICKQMMDEEDDAQRRMGLYILQLTAKSLLRKMDGSWDENMSRFCFADFLRDDYIMLDDDFLPELQSSFCDLPDFNIFARIRMHAENENHLSFEERINQIYSSNPVHHNFGTGCLIERYLASMDLPVPELPEYANDCLHQAITATKVKVNEFRRNYALAIAVGQISHGNPLLEKAENIVQYWYDTYSEAGNYGFIYSLIESTYKYIRSESAKRKTQLLATLQQMVANNADTFAKYPDAEERIRSLIESEIFSVAEDEMNHLGKGEFIRNLERPEALTYLKDFWEKYDLNFRQVANISTTIQNLLFSTHIAKNRQQKGARGLVENWIRGTANNTERIARLLTLLGWTNIAVQRTITPGDSTEMYHVRRDKPMYGTPMHLVAPFGSAVSEVGFDVVCLYGAHDHTSILEKIRVLDGMDGGACLILLDFALSELDRRALAKKIKRDHYYRTYLILDRVLLCYLYNNYNGSIINRVLMSVGMPFSSYQPYVAESANYMPPEMFIGRVNELRQIKESSKNQTESVNLIYGGRQLGKSALLKKAQSDIDGSDNKRAVFVDIYERNCAMSARLISEKLINEKILSDDCVTDDWMELVDNIRRRLNDDSKEPIEYLLLMLDEADKFIKDCASHNYIPVSQLKILQSEMPDRFKFVLAGLHDIVRFNRASSLGNNTGIPHLKSLVIRPFSKAEANQLLLEPLSYLGFILEDYTQATQIIAQTNYFPGLIQLYCQKLVQSVSRPDYGGFKEGETPPYRVSNDLIGRVLADNNFIYEIGEKFEMTLRLEPRYYLIALLLCHLSYVQDTTSTIDTGTFDGRDKAPVHGMGYTAENIWDEAKDLKLPSIYTLDLDQVHTLMEELHELNILRKETSNSFNFASDNFRGILGTDDVIFRKLLEEADKEVIPE